MTRSFTVQNLDQLYVFTAVLTPKPFKTAGPAVLNGKPCHLHQLGLNKGLQMAEPFQLSAILTLFLATTLLTIELVFVFCGIQV